jgi:hypothetical protein
MKILFLCGALELGRDGVGDYVRRLAEQISSIENQVSILALSDPFIEEATTLAYQIEAPSTIHTLRLPVRQSLQQRLHQAKLWIAEFQPDLISLQFVSFSFHPKGLPFGLGKLLADMGQDYTWHIMFHELWVGMAHNDTFKHKVWGKMQKGLIKGLINNLKPSLIHTQCSLYFKQLQKEGYNVKMLPLFSNIEIDNYFSGSACFSKYNLADELTAKFVFFGGLHPESKLVELIDILDGFYASQKSNFEFLYVGRNGGELDNHLPVLKQKGVKYTVIGELPPQEVSQLLTASTYGVSTGSPEMLEKNGTVAAMLLHRLPVICIGRTLDVRGISKIEMMAGTYRLEDVVSILSARPAIEFHNTLPAVAQQYQHDLLQLA